MITSCFAKAPSTERRLEKLRASTWRWVRFTDPLQQFDVGAPEKYSLTFAPDGVLYIKADCNRANGPYKAYQQASLTIEIRPMTRVMCIKGSERDQYVFFPIEVDNYYFSPREAARKVRFPREKRTIKNLERHFRYHSIPKIVGPGQTISGFVYALPEIGVKDFRIHLVGPEKQVNLYFVLPVPGVKLDIENIHIDQFINQISLVDSDGWLLYEKLSELPCCTSNKEGNAHGDPLNLVIIGHLEDFLPDFLTRGWEVTEDIHISSIFTEIMAFLLGIDYRYSPISALYFDGQKQDIALQKPRANIYARNHFRLWLTEMSYNGEPIWVGQISRDIGVIFTTRHWWLSTHDIDPDIDEARNFFVQDMLSTQAVKKFGYIRGMKLFPEKEPLMNFMEQPIFTDGLRAVFIFDVDHTPITDIELFHWEWPEEYKLNHTIKWEPGNEEVESIQIGDSPAR